MTFVVTDNCQRCRYTDCAAVCPVECFHGDDEMLYIDPEVCIDCGVCVSECPVEAIYEEGLLPAEQQAWLPLNAERARQLPVVKGKAMPHPDVARRLRELGLDAT